MGEIRDGDGRIRAAGGVVWRRAADGTPEIALVHRPRYDDWSHPKGKLDPGEHDLTAAWRELHEETGLQVRLGRPLGDRSYPVAGGEKLVRWWAAEAVGGRFVPNDEVDRLEWMPPDAVPARLTHAEDAALLETMLSRPHATVPVLLVRHGHAGDKSSWEADDRSRPLSARGRGDALHLAAPLQAYCPERIASADLVRCTATVQPLADALGLPVQMEATLDETANATDERPACSTVREALRRGVPTVLCSQGEVIPLVVRDLAGEDGVDLPFGHKPHKGSVWVLHGAAGRLVEAEYVRTFEPVAEAG